MGNPVLVPVVLAGGSGTRLWPISRSAYPKHLVEIFGDESLLQATIRRALAVARPDHVLTIGAAAQAFLIGRQLAEIDPGLRSGLVLEPSGRNTAAAIALAALIAVERNQGEAVLWICPSDHLIQDEHALLEAVRAGALAAARGDLVTFGIRPSRPETGYGYIRLGAADPVLASVLKVDRFVEKPPRDEAEAMLKAGGHVWNSGMFLFRADRLLAELARFEPQLVEDAKAALAAGEQAPAIVPEAARWAAVRSVPIDKAVMERSERVVCVPCDPQWSDVGSWQAIWELMDRDHDGNATTGDVLLEDAHNNLVRSERRLVALAGVSDLVVVETADAVLVADRVQSEQIKTLVSLLASANRREATVHASEVRPWGKLTALAQGPGFRVRELCVDPGARLSRQRHPGRSEHWIIVAGEAAVELDEDLQHLEPGAVVSVPAGAVHRLSNPADTPLRLIEVALGGDLDDTLTQRLDPPEGGRH
ncbi:MAG TPA: mannose-1-phosphate guanylyltransferase/mannose-6-phosphate isomerase [Geminicoccus sp.]|uniref:mannose-1-phosphate guanylyltransferase/mannose-6-phosphate isomerase n=1 Tax=Geminicoccus sp. TaxID=2024832 RepID=UPI002E3014F3|nr:mannose-1-phosphate guanylyltransferase/mannose-6-phosphate isomerase [Geminicoccus sp.]HEX2526934.1 mannose-1-phosphate guanylyltransferase/mannose-6-phosphate isomerase [Geminicoccus sp.]